ncbi:hypothetical protein PMIN01_03446 [Paraphaeosphaeria minitans]|uniref:Uncharacterized protein n=1 Tax=Paraphaeosphaeria minitans TaxID=565426 RepID=A0A9P6GN71_9PLEO|nr:hypothetical protein PMIN01_03446 [Paraphaeosphaeria minitans]
MFVSTSADKADGQVVLTGRAPWFQPSFTLTGGQNKKHAGEAETTGLLKQEQQEALASCGRTHSETNAANKAATETETEAEAEADGNATRPGSRQVDLNPPSTTTELLRRHTCAESPHGAAAARQTPSVTRRFLTIHHPLHTAHRPYNADTNTLGPLRSAFTSVARRPPRGTRCAAGLRTNSHHCRATSATAPRRHSRPPGGQPATERHAPRATPSPGSSTVLIRDPLCVFDLEYLDPRQRQTETSLQWHTRNVTSDNPPA